MTRYLRIEIIVLFVIASSIGCNNFKNGKTENESDNSINYACSYELEIIKRNEDTIEVKSILERIELRKRISAIGKEFLYSSSKYNTKDFIIFKYINSFRPPLGKIYKLNLKNGEIERHEFDCMNSLQSDSLFSIHDTVYKLSQNRLSLIEKTLLNIEQDSTCYCHKPIVIDGTSFSLEVVKEKELVSSTVFSSSTKELENLKELLEIDK